VLRIENSIFYTFSSGRIQKLLRWVIEKIGEVETVMADPWGDRDRPSHEEKGVRIAS